MRQLRLRVSLFAKTKWIPTTEIRMDFVSGIIGFYVVLTIFAFILKVMLCLSIMYMYFVAFFDQNYVEFAKVKCTINSTELEQKCSCH